ncbi:hypothetical protein TNCV_1398231 [Trichonephila clavipes]|nr:hypothetical protein TNCV_1398231 [Trichonephila clavipes]
MIVTISNMETEPPDGTLRPVKSSLPKLNDESMTDYERLKPVKIAPSAIEVRLQQQLADFCRQESRPD